MILHREMEAHDSTFYIFSYAYGDVVLFICVWYILYVLAHEHMLASEAEGIATRRTSPPDRGGSSLWGSEVSE